jgi:hypothetical protein
VDRADLALEAPEDRDPEDRKEATQEGRLQEDPTEPWLLPKDPADS